MESIKTIVEIVKKQIGEKMLEEQKNSKNDKKRFLQVIYISEMKD